jgi:hypothetical protein
MRGSILPRASQAKGHFILWLSIEQTKDFSNLIGGEKKLVCLAFTLEADDQWTKGLQNAYMAALFGSFGTKSLCDGGKLDHIIYGNSNFS